MFKRRPLRTLGVLATGVGGMVAGAASVSEALPLSATGRVKALAPPVLRDSSGAVVTARLLQVQAVFRHGARLPVSDAGCNDGLCRWTPADSDKSAQLRDWGGVHVYEFGDGDPHEASEVFAETRGSLSGGGIGGGLTPVGLEQAVELGAQLRAQYVDESATSCATISPPFLLPASWSSARRLVATRSTRVERTVYTAAGVLHGLYPPPTGEPAAAADIELNGPPAHEFMVLNDAMAPRLRELFDQGMRLSTANLDGAQRAVIDVCERAGWTCDNAGWKLISYRDWYSTRAAAGKRIPAPIVDVACELDGATARQMHDIFEGGARFTDDPEGTRQEALRLTIGRMWSEIIDGLTRPDGTLRLFSAHDWTVSPLLMCVAPRDDPMFDRWPPYCSNLVFEVWSTREADCATPRRLRHPASCGAHANDAGRHVRIVYNGEVVKLKGTSSETCTLSDFRATVEPYCVRDLGDEARPRGETHIEAGNSGFNAAQDE